MKRASIFLLALLACSGRASAESILIPATLFAAGQYADIRTTQLNLRGTCVESNPLLGPKATMPQMITLKLITSAPLAIAMVVLQKQGHPVAARRLGYAMAGVGGGAAVWNATRSCGR